MRGFSKLRVDEAERLAGAFDPTGRVSFTSGVIAVQVSRRSDEVQSHQIDLNNVWLPATSWAEGGTNLLEREDLTDLVVSALRVYLRRTGESKSTDSVVRSIASCLCKFFEYGWLHHCYRAEDWSEAQTADLLKELAVGGWQKALRIQERTSQWIATAREEDIAALINSAGGLREELLGHRLKTSARGRELTPALSLILAARPQQSTRRRNHITTSAKGMSQTLLRQTLGWLNLLADIPKDGLGFTPYENVFKLALENGRPSGRTKNISPGEVGILLREAFEWIYRFSKPVLALFEEITDALERGQISMSDRTRFVAEQLAASRHRLDVEECLGIKVCGSRVRNSERSDLALHTIAQALFDACFIVIGFMNARRADEVQHRKIGIYYDALSVFDERLGLHECDFYLEKYRKGYKKFFVNDCTVDAVKLLQRTSDLAIRLRVSAELRPTGEGNSSVERKISQVPRFIYVRGRTSPEWFSFNAGPNGPSRFFFERAFKGNPTWHLRPHMLRRAHALIYYYRYEDSELLALSLQLDHFSAGSTTVYISEASVPDGRIPLSAFGRVTEKEKAQLDLEQRGVHLEMEKVHQEKMQTFIESIISGTDRTSGGLAKLMGRFHAKLAARLDYSGLDQREQTNMLLAAVQGRGHRLRPFRHGDCGAPEDRSGKGLGRCYDDHARHLDRSRASPLLCHKCPYHRASAGHLEGLKKERAWMQERLVVLPEGSLMHQRQLAEISSLEKVISFHADALGTS